MSWIIGEIGVTVGLPIEKIQPIELPTENIFTIGLMTNQTQRYRNGADHKDCKVGEVVAVARHNTSLFHYSITSFTQYCLTSLSSPVCVTQRNTVTAIGMVL